MKSPINSSSWISEVLYRPGYLAVFTQSADKALLYGPNVPAHLCGLLQAGLGGQSVGRAYHKLVKGKYAYQEIKGQEAVAELRRVMVLGA